MAAGHALPSTAGIGLRASHYRDVLERYPDFDLQAALGILVARGVLTGFSLGTTT